VCVCASLVIMEKRPLNGCSSSSSSSFHFCLYFYESDVVALIPVSITIAATFHVWSVKVQ